MAAGTYVFALVILVSTNYATTELLEWPEQCEGKYYCAESITARKPSSYPNESWINFVLDRDMVMPMLVPRDGMKVNFTPDYIDDVANCGTKENNVTSIYAIKDENDIVWYVPATSNFSVNAQTYECMDPEPRVTGYSQSGLLSPKLLEQEVYCMEQIVAFKFPVLSQDLSKLETEPKSPKGGLPVSCSAKILKRK